MGKEVKQLLIATPDGFYPPYEMIVDDKLTGFHIELLQLAEQQLNIKITFKRVPWKRALAMVKQGTVDAITFISSTQERQQFAHFHDDNILSYTQDGFFVRTDKLKDFIYTGDLQQLTPYNIGMLKGYSYGEAFDNAQFLTKDDGTVHEKQLIKKVLSNRLEVGVGNISRIIFIARQLGAANKITFLKPNLSRAPHYLGFSKKKHSIRFVEHFAKTLDYIRTTASYDELLNKYRIQSGL